MTDTTSKPIATAHCRKEDGGCGRIVSQTNGMWFGGRFKCAACLAKQKGAGG